MKFQQFVLSALSAFVAFGASAASQSRVVVLADSYEAIADDLKSEGGRVFRPLKYRKGFAGSFTESQLKRFKAKYPQAEFKIDAIVSLDAQVSAKPGPVAPPQPVQTNPWGIAAIGADIARTYSRGAGVKVCVLDSGVQADHPDLLGNVVGGTNFVVKKGGLKPALWADDNGHGTHVAGTIAALDNGIGVIGVAPEAKIFAVKSFDSAGNGYLSDIIDGFRACMANNVQIINMSFNTLFGDAALRYAIDDANAAGIAVVGAAGNRGGAIEYPARYAGVIAVTALDTNNLLATFSARGPEAAFTAPGVGVQSTFINSGYAIKSGTSQAAPHVSGTIALKISSQSLGLLATDVGLTTDEQGQGLIDAEATVLNQPVVPSP